MGETFAGYVRADGSVGVRNHLLILSTGGMTGRTARRIAAAVEGAVAVTLPYCSGLFGEDLAVHRGAIRRLALHPNVGAAVLVGDNPIVMAAALAEIAPSGRPHLGLTLDDCGHDALALTDRGIRAAAALAVRIS
ncbi:MAG: UxaA family hydrolase, partial [Rhodospirillales bacterium]|nr:UxaA family hydrolase [Rhodospirillales bacterium]